MKCTKVPLPGGGAAIVCTRGRRPARCQVPGCGSPHVALCDFPVLRAGKVGTCDQRLCAQHRHPIEGEKDHCPAHHKGKLPLWGLSLYQPLAWAVLHGGRRLITCQVPAGIYLALHACCMADALLLQRLRDAGMAVPEDLPADAILAVAQVQRQVEEDYHDEWEQGPGVLLHQVVHLPEPIECSGGTPLFALTPTLRDRVRRAYKAAAQPQPALITKTMLPGYPWDDQ